MLFMPRTAYTPFAKACQLHDGKKIKYFSNCSGNLIPLNRYSEVPHASDSHPIGGSLPPPLTCCDLNDMYSVENIPDCQLQEEAFCQVVRFGQPLAIHFMLGARSEARDEDFPSALTLSSVGSDTTMENRNEIQPRAYVAGPTGARRVKEHVANDEFLVWKAGAVSTS